VGRLRVDPIHELYWEQCGNPDGLPVLFLHGGPGSGCGANHRRFFNPDRYRAVLFDQRGSGRSTPIAEIRDNTTPLLVEDIEALRRHLGIERWLVFGGSWGSTLALAYAEAHPERCTGLILRGIWLCRQRDLVWWIEDIGQVYPEEWRLFAEYIPEGERADLLGAYHRRLVDPDPAIHMPAAQVWKSYESNCTSIGHDPKQRSAKAASPTTLAMSRMEAHYFINQAFLAPNQLLDRADALRAMPVTIVHGRYDMVCPIDNADALARRLPHAHYTISPFAGHSAFEPVTAAALIAATEKHLTSNA
jgi:proline iminopeptidase